MNNDQSALLASIFGAFFVVYLLIAIALWILQGFAFYSMFSKARVSNPWLAFIPIANLWPYMKTIKKSAWNILWLLVPIVDVVFMIIWMVRLFKAFNINPLWTLMLIATFIPILNMFVGIAFLVLYCYMGFSRNVQYNPNFDIKPPVSNTNFSA